MKWKEFLKPNAKVIGLSIIIFFFLFGFPIPFKSQPMCFAGNCPESWGVLFVGGINHGSGISQDTFIVFFNQIFYAYEIAFVYIISYIISCFIISKFKKKK